MYILPHQARANFASTAASISQLYGLVEQTTAATTAQLEATAGVLQQAANSRPAAEQKPLEPGLDQVVHACWQLHTQTHAQIHACRHTSKQTSMLHITVQH